MYRDSKKFAEIENNFRFIAELHRKIHITHEYTLINIQIEIQMFIEGD